MIGLMVLLGFGVYLIISSWVIHKTASWAERNNRSPRKWGWLAAFVMYNLVFWDLIPTLIAHKYYCATQSGFWAYKAPEQWKSENPGMVETLKRSLEPKRIENVEKNTARYWLTQRFYDDVQRERVFLSIYKTEKTFFDAKAKEDIAKSINFYRGVGNVLAMGGTWDQWRQAFSVSLGNRGCGAEGKSPTDTFDQYIFQFWKWGENK